jgi:hypothetical protein
MKDLWLVDYFSKQAAPPDVRYRIFESESHAFSTMASGDYLYKINAEDLEYLGKLTRVLTHD